ENHTLTVHVIMRPAPQVLDPVTINAHATASHLSVFDERRLHNNGGHFITWSDIQRRQPFETLDLFNDVLGVRVGRPAYTDPYVESTRGVGAAGGPCPLQVGFDGMVFRSGFNVSDISPREIYGIEIYDGASTIPGQYLSATAGGSCGLIMIWTIGGAASNGK